MIRNLVRRSIFIAKNYPIKFKPRFYMDSTVAEKTYQNLKAVWDKDVIPALKEYGKL